MVLLEERAGSRIIGFAGHDVEGERDGVTPLEGEHLFGVDGKQRVTGKRPDGKTALRALEPQPRSLSPSDQNQPHLSLPQRPFAFPEGGGLFPLGNLHGLGGFRLFLAGRGAGLDEFPHLPDEGRVQGSDLLQEMFLLDLGQIRPPLQKVGLADGVKKRLGFCIGHADSSIFRLFYHNTLSFSKGKE